MPLSEKDRCAIEVICLKKMECFQNTEKDSLEGLEAANRQRPPQKNSTRPELQIVVLGRVGRGRSYEQPIFLSNVSQVFLQPGEV